MDLGRRRGWRGGGDKMEGAGGGGIWCREGGPGRGMFHMWRQFSKARQFPLRAVDKNK